MSGGDYYFTPGGGTTAAAVLDLMARAGRNEGPAIVFDAHFSRSLPKADLPQVLAHAWSSAEYPEQALDGAWVAMFHAAGFTADGVPATPPDSITLYRGATEAGRHGMSWTSDLDAARKFARGELRGRPAGSVWTATVPAVGLLAHITSREESEWVVDPAPLRAAGVHQLEMT